MPLGVSEDALWQKGIQEILPGSMLLLYTDGVVDAQNPFGEFLGEEGMLNIIQTRIGQSAISIQEALITTLVDFAGAESQSDDITLMTILRERPGEPHQD
jgi:sigma-B regulation protein RsbU (phosphoserine phosphatase)